MYGLFEILGMVAVATICVALLTAVATLVVNWLYQPRRSAEQEELADAISGLSQIVKRFMDQDTTIAEVNRIITRHREHCDTKLDEIKSRIAEFESAQAPQADYPDPTPIPLVYYTEEVPPEAAPEASDEHKEYADFITGSDGSTSPNITENREKASHTEEAQPGSDTGAESEEKKDTHTGGE